MANSISVDVAFPSCAPSACSGCGQLLFWQAARGEDIWIWADQQGRTMVGGKEGETITGFPHPWTVLTDISNRILASSKVPKSKRGPAPSEYEVQLYSALLARVELGHEFRHIHTHDRSCMHNGHKVELPWHCGWPMRLRPSGWYCRKCSAVCDPPAPSGEGWVPVPEEWNRFRE